MSGTAPRHTSASIEDRAGVGPVHVKRALDDVSRDRLRREVEVLGELRHPDVVEVIDHADDEMVARVAGRRTLADVGPAEADRVAGWLAALDQLLDDLRSLGWTHGAIRASHVVIGSEGRITLCSWRRAERREAGHPGFAADRAALAELARVVCETTGATRPALGRRDTGMVELASTRRPGAARDRDRGTGAVAAALRSVAVAVAAVTAGWAVIRLGPSRPVAEPAGLAIAILRGVAIAASAYLAVTSLVLAAAQTVGSARGVSRVLAALPRPIRRGLVALSGAGVLSLLAPRPTGPTAVAPTTTNAAPGSPRDATSTTIDAPTTSSTSKSTWTTTSAPAATTAPLAADAGPPPAPPLSDRPPATAPVPSVGTWTVRPGDHLWRIAEATTTSRLGRSPSEREVARYWRRLIDANRTRLVDPANPDLIHTGQEFELPD